MSKPRKPSAIKMAEVEQLMGVLNAGQRGEWITAGEISLKIFGYSTEDSKRRVRLIASVARPAVFSYPGSPGYKLFCDATQADIALGIFKIRAQGKASFRDANVYEMAADLRFKVTQPGDHPNQMSFL